jgi:AraC-like DNA-binding protein
MIRTCYRELAPPATLADRVVCLWTLNIGSADAETGYLQPVLPDGCVDIVWIGRTLPIVAGPATRPVLVGLPAGTDVTGVRFQPGWAAACLGLPASELLNLDVPLADLWGYEAEHLSEQIFHGDAPAAVLRRLAAILVARLCAVPAPDPLIPAAIRWLARHPPGRVYELRRLSGLSERQLQRRFIAAVGYGPKTFQRIVRLQRLLHLEQPVSAVCRDLSALALSAGYADQAHMCREVRVLAGKTPQTLLHADSGSTLAMSDLFNTSAGGSGYDEPPEPVDI